MSIEQQMWMGTGPPVHVCSRHTVEIRLPHTKTRTLAKHTHTHPSAPVDKSMHTRRRAEHRDDTQNRHSTQEITRRPTARTGPFT